MNDQRLGICCRRRIRAARSLVIAAPFILLLVGFAGAQSADVYIYPAKGQTQQQQDKDRDECHSWAAKQTGFDPSRPQTTVAPATSASQPYRPSQPHVLRGAGRGAALGAVGGAIAGNAATGAAAGAAMGGLAGAVRRRDERMRQSTQQQADVQSSTAKQSQQASAYRRAMAACLEGRGYTVK
jgi:hypothetical protein